MWWHSARETAISMSLRISTGNYSFPLRTMLPLTFLFYTSQTQYGSGSPLLTHSHPCSSSGTWVQHSLECLKALPSLPIAMWRFIFYLNSNRERIREYISLFAHHYRNYLHKCWKKRHISLHELHALIRVSGNVHETDWFLILWRIQWLRLFTVFSWIVLAAGDSDGEGFLSQWEKPLPVRYEKTVRGCAGVRGLWSTGPC